MMQFRRLSKGVAVSYRLISSSQVKPLVGVSVDDEGIATLRLQRSPVNSINLELVHDLHDSICEVERNKCKGMVLTSALKIFSAGMDLNEFYKPDIKRMIQLKEALFDVVIKILETNMVTTAAINGHTAAGGCIFVLTSDYRVMTRSPATIGLNDIAVGIKPAKWVVDLMLRVLGTRQTEFALTTSCMFPVDEALKVGFIDDIGSDDTETIQKCKSYIKMHDNISPVLRNATKRFLRQDYLTQLEKHRQQYIKDFLAMATSPEFQALVERYIQSIKQRKITRAINN